MDLTGVKFSYDRDDQAEDITNCLQNLILTPAGTVPLDRNFGIDQSLLGYPPEVAKNLLALELIKKASIYEPRVIVKGLDLETDTDNPEKNIAKVVYAYNGNSAIGF